MSQDNYQNNNNNGIRNGNNSANTNGNSGLDRKTRVVSAEEMAAIRENAERRARNPFIHDDDNKVQTTYSRTGNASATGTPGPRSQRNRSRANSTASVGEGNSKNASVAGAQTKKPKKKAPNRAVKKERKKKRHLWLKRIILALLCLILIGILAGCAFVFSVIKNTPPIDPSTLYDQLAETTRMYDDEGTELDTIFFGSNRDLIEVDKMPDHLLNAFIALEDKSFRTHHGFNIVRIIGAIRDSLFRGGQISGTSTITQQLARNIYLQDTQFDYDIRRKISEAYYALRIEKELSKDEIIQGYLNAIYFGYGCFGVETAAQNYFGKSVSELTLAESAALAALPQAPDAFQFIDFIEGGTAAAYPETALYETTDGVYVVNDASKDRREICLNLMRDQGYITEAECNQAKAVPLKDMLNPVFESSTNSNAAYFADYCISEVIEDLMEEKGMDYETAWSTVYQGGLTIYSTLDSQAQEVIRSEFDDPSNYPWAEPSYDEYGNIVNDDWNVMLYDYDNFFDGNGNFILYPDDYQMLSDGSMQINYGHNLHIYTTEVAEGTDYSLEFKDMYYYDDNWNFYSINGGYINIPRTYKTIDGDNNLIISKDFFDDPEFAEYFVVTEDGNMAITPKAYSLNPRTIQPQVAMTIVENSTGHIKAMVGGRSTSGRMIYNRAINPRQPGSSIKPLGVYSAALQQSVEEARAGEKHTYTNYHIDQQGTSLYGDYLTASSIVIDEKTTVDGKTWPTNFGGYYSGTQTLRSAMRQSLNTCAVKLWFQVGPEYSAANVKRFGITTLVEDGPVNDINPAALALGGMTNGVTTLEMASAYTVFPNNGVRYDTSSYTKVLDRNGNVLLENNPEEHRVLDEGVAWIMTDILHDVVTSGTATNAYVPNTFVGGKTGTTSDEKDDWFDGFTPNYSASLWIGCDTAIELSNSSVIATILWGNIMRQIDAAYEGEMPGRPDSVVYYNGEYYVDGTQYGTISQSTLTNKTIYLCEDTGLLATPECPHSTKKTYSTTDGYTPPKYYCYLHNSDPNTYPVGSEGTELMEQIQQQEEEEARMAEEERQRQEEEARIAEEERLRQEEEARRAEEERIRQEEEARRAEEERQRQEEEARIAEEERQRQEEEARRAEEERQRQEQEAQQQQESEGDGG